MEIKEKKTLLKITTEDGTVNIFSGDVKALRMLGDDILAKMFEILPDDILEELGSMIVEMASKVIALSTDSANYLDQFDRATWGHILTVSHSKKAKERSVVVPLPVSAKKS